MRTQATKRQRKLERCPRCRGHGTRCEEWTLGGKPVHITRECSVCHGLGAISEYMAKKYEKQQRM